MRAIVFETVKVNWDIQDIRISCANFSAEKDSYVLRKYLRHIYGIVQIIIKFLLLKVKHCL